MHKLLVVGVGSIGERHVRCFARTGRVTTSICEVNGGLRAEVAQRYRIDRSYGDLDEALEQSYDVALIATPAHLHVAMATRLAQAGTHLIIEKPLSTSFDGVAQLQQLVEQRNLTCAVAYPFRANPALQAMRYAIREGRFGRPVQLVAVCGQNFAHYRPAYRQIYFKQHETGGGAIQDALAHILNAGEWLLGPIQRLIADAEHNVLEGVEVEDTVQLVARHDQIMANYNLNLFQMNNELSITVNCDRGTARFELDRWRWNDEIEGPWHEEVFGPFERDDLYIKQAKLLLDAMESKSEPPCTLHDAAQTLRVTLTALRSAQDPSKFLNVNP